VDEHASNGVPAFRTMHHAFAPRHENLFVTLRTRSDRLLRYRGVSRLRSKPLWRWEEESRRVSEDAKLDELPSHPQFTHMSFHLIMHKCKSVRTAGSDNLIIASLELVG
jgi:hypothetical protein